ncbi:MAG: PASTA domain-containing protein [Terriglobia bacterium]
MGLLQRVQTLFRFFLLFTVLVAVALISAVLTIRLTIHGRQETMPNLVGQALEAAQSTASGLDLELKVEDKLFNAKFPVNQIVSQQPLPGTPIKAGQLVHVIVGLGPPRVVVPNLVGSSLRAAQITAVQRGLTVGSVTALPLPGGEPDQVLAQDPPPASPDVHSPVVNFLVAANPPPPSYLCPNFVGQGITGARRELEKAGMKVGETIPVATDAAPKGTILTQSPAAGSKIGPDTVFTFQISE